MQRIGPAHSATRTAGKQGAPHGLKQKVAVTQLTVFSDFACPASYVTEAALWSLDDLDLELRFRAFELYPDGGTVGTTGFGEEAWATLERLAASAGIVIRPRAATPRTRKAHEAAHFARVRGKERELRRAIFAALWEGDQDIGRIDVLAGLGTEAGFNADDVRIALDIESFQESVDADLEFGRRLNIPGTPVIFVGQGPAAGIVTGAQGPDAIRKAVDDWMNVERPAIDGI